MFTLLLDDFGIPKNLARIASIKANESAPSSDGFIEVFWFIIR